MRGRAESGAPTGSARPRGLDTTGGMSCFKELQELEDQGIDLIEVLGQDRYLKSPYALARIIEQPARSGDNLYTELLCLLTPRRFPAEQAESLWRAIMKHKARMSDALGRKVSFRVAALDYLTSRNAVLRSVRLVAKPETESILNFVNVDEVAGVYTCPKGSSVAGIFTSDSFAFAASIRTVPRRTKSWSRSHAARGASAPRADGAGQLSGPSARWSSCFRSARTACSSSRCPSRYAGPYSSTALSTVSYAASRTPRCATACASARHC